MKLTFLAVLTLTASSGRGDDHALGLAVLADFVVAGRGVDDGGTAGGAAGRPVNSAAAGNDGGAGSRFTVRCSRLDGSRRRGRDVVRGADLGEADFELALDLGAVPEIHGQVGACETPVLGGLPLRQESVGALGEVALGIQGRRVFLHHRCSAGGALLLEGGCGRWCGNLLGRCAGGQENEEQGGDEESFHGAMIAQSADFGKVGKGRCSLMRHHRRNDQAVATASTKL